MKTYQASHKVLGSIYFRTTSIAKALKVAKRLGSTVVRELK